MSKRITSSAANLPTVKVSARGAARLDDGHVWVYRSDVVSADGVSPGSPVTVTDHRGQALGIALYSSASQIAIRLISRQPVADLPALLRERIAAAMGYRETIIRDTDAYRVIFSEADFLPGLIVDRYHDVLSVQILTQAMDAEAIRSAVVKTLAEELTPAGIVERVDGRIRELEQLPPRKSGLLWGEKSSTVVTMNTAQMTSGPADGVRFQYDGLEGQKTGAFLDQRENYAAAAQYAHGDALDVFCYQGAFALHMSPRCSQVTAVDSSRPALEVADQNAILNRRDPAQPEIEWIEANAFDLLKDYSASGHQYDTIVLDPPAFAKTKRDLDAALRGYKELNLRALKMLRPAGILVTCSCSYHVSQADLLGTVASAALDAHKTVRLLELRGQSLDHPVLLNVPETSYLKCVIAHVSS